MQKYAKVLTAISIIVSSLSLSIAPAFAATAAKTPTPPVASPNAGQALEIAPPVIYLTVSPGQKLNTQLYLRDVSSSNLLVTGQVNDFVAAGEDGTPKLLLDANAAANDPYGLNNWITNIPKLTLIPHEIKTMTIPISVPANASPGGHYGVLRFTATAPSLNGNGVSLAASLGALLLITVTGNISHNLSVEQFAVNNGGANGSFFEGGTLNFVERLKNNGNVHEQPVGQVTITDMFGKKFAAVNVNLPPANILPQSIRKFSQPLNSEVIGNKKLFGRYTADLKVTYGPNKQVINSKLSFWVIPYKLVAVIIVVIIGGFFALRYGLKRYNRYIISRSSGRRR